MSNDNERAGKICEITIGKFEDVKLEQARIRADEFNHIIGQKKDPSMKPVAPLTYGELFRLYIDEYARLHTITWEESVANHRRYFDRFEKKLVSRMKRAEVQNWVNNLAAESGRHTANRNYDTMRAVFSWGLRKDLIAGESPCLGVDRFKTQARERFIQPGTEYLKFAKALSEEPNETIQDFFWMCLFTGARRSNVLAMEWSQIEMERMVWRIPVTKNGDSQTIPLTPNCMEILRRRKDDGEAHERWVFPSDRRGRKTGVIGHLSSPKTAWARLLERAEIDDLRIHDLRRTAGSYMAIQGVSPTIIGKALGHRSVQATAIYSRLTQDPVRQALENAQAALTMPDRLLSKNGKVEQLAE